jgi:beta-galactosidase
MFAEQLTTQADDVKVLMRYRAPRSWLDGQAAVVTRKVGAGSITYIGAWLDGPGMQRAVQWMMSESGTQPDLFAAPQGVEVYRRVGSGRQVFIVENDSREEQTVNLPAAMNNLLTGETPQVLHLPVYGVAVLEQPASGK